MDHHCQQYLANQSHFFVGLDNGRLAIFAVLEDESLDMQLHEPKDKGDIVGDVEAMPKGTDDEDIELVD